MEKCDIIVYYNVLIAVLANSSLYATQSKDGSLFAATMHVTAVIFAIDPHELNILN